jgi:hypothetical protein
MSAYLDVFTVVAGLVGIEVVGGESVASAFVVSPTKEITDRDIAKRRTGCFKGFSCARRIGQQADNKRLPMSSSVITE